MSVFQKATKRAIKARVAFEGPTGSGKTWTALVWAAELGKRIALIDTERGSASLYSDSFDFDVLEMSPPYGPERLITALKDAEQAGYDVVIIDSLSHFWEGEGGVLDMVDGASQRAQGNSFAGWKVGTPALRHLVDTMLGIDAHLLVTMRSKMEYVLEEDGRGKKVPRKIGMAPVMRGGVEYEFAVVADLDLEHRLTISKSRCSVLADAVLAPGRAKDGADMFRVWLETGEPMASRNDIDALVARMNALPEETVKPAKKAFVDFFGLPVHLLASRLAEAQAWVSAYETGETDHPPTKDSQPDAGSVGPAATGVPVSEAGRSISGDDAAASPPPAAAASSRAKTPAQMLHIHAGKIEGVGEDGLDLVILNVTGGQTDSAKDLDAHQLVSAERSLRDLDQMTLEGRVAWRVRVSELVDQLAHQRMTEQLERSVEQAAS